MGKHWQGAIRDNGWHLCSIKRGTGSKIRIGGCQKRKIHFYLTRELMRTIKWERSQIKRGTGSNIRIGGCQKRKIHFYLSRELMRTRKWERSQTCSTLQHCIHKYISTNTYTYTYIHIYKTPTNLHMPQILTISWIPKALTSTGYHITNTHTNT